MLIKTRTYTPSFADLNERHVVLNSDPDYRKKLLALIDLLFVDFSIEDFDTHNRTVRMSHELVLDLLTLRGA